MLGKIMTFSSPVSQLVVASPNGFNLSHSSRAGGARAKVVSSSVGHRGNETALLFPNSLRILPLVNKRYPIILFSIIPSYKL